MKKLTLLAGAVLLVLAGCSGPAPDLPTFPVVPVVAVSAPPTPVDLVAGGTLRTTDGQQITLPGIWTGKDQVQVARIPAGWAVLGSRAVWLVAGGTARKLVEDADEAAVSPDGEYLAYRQADWVTVARIGADGLHRYRQTVVPGHEGSQGRTGAHLFGWAGHQLSLYYTTGLAVEGFDLWDPASGDYEDQRDVALAGVFGPRGDILLGAVYRDRPCMVSVTSTSAGPRAGGGTCGPGVDPWRFYALSPDGRWILGGGSLYDTTLADPVAVFPEQKDLGRGDGAWVDAGTLVVANWSHNGFLRISTAHPGAHPEPLPLPDGIGAAELVQHYGR